MASPRIKKVASVIKRELAGALLFDSKNPMLRGVVVTHVEVAPDLRTALAYYTTGIEAGFDRLAVQDQLDRAAPFFTRLLRSRIKLKHLPKLHFRFDESVERMTRIEEILKEIKRG